MVTQQTWQHYIDNEKQSSDDLFITEDGKTFAGRHLIIDLWGCQQLDHLSFIERTLCDAAKVAGATLLHIHLHHFTPNGGVSGVAVLAESHISIHTWPERGYAALDIFMCGNTQPKKAVELLKQKFQPQRIEISTHLRGIIKE
ncbi:MAG: adenosylmethionine decarboxylase [Cocleimonas sp.]|nr:adenosylmethionine decarboxylase [Cocleimonas sp.]